MRFDLHHHDVLTLIDTMDTGLEHVVVYVILKTLKVL